MVKSVIARLRYRLRMFAFVVFLLNGCAYAASSNYSLILVQFGKDPSGAQTQTLVRYRFSRGQLVGNENILTTRTSELRYDLGENAIYDNRYVITSWGDVVEISSGRLLFKSKGNLAGIDSRSNTVVLRVARNEEEGTFGFDLTARKYHRIDQDSLWRTKGVLSPNGQLSASGDNAEIKVHYKDGRVVSVGKDFRREGTTFCSSFASPTFAWVDDAHLVTQKGNGRLVIVGLDGHTEPLLNIPNVVPPACGPTLQQDANKQILYESRGQTWRIDPLKRTFEPYSYQAVGNDFEIEHQPSQAYGRIVRFRATEIGRLWCLPWEARTAPGRIAVAFGPVGSNLGYPEGVKVWSEESGQWIAIKPAWLTAIVGWVED